MSQNFYTAHLMGGLGNQMFQIAHAVSQGLKHDVYVSFKETASIPNQGNQPYKYKENIFRKINFSQNKNNTIRIYESNWNEPNINFNPKDSIEFYGYYQSSKNFLGFDNEIKDLFRPTEVFKNKINLLYPEFELNENVSIHIRRGDYLRFPEVHPTVPIDYIKKALSYFPNNIKKFVFTDDRDWVQQNLDFDYTSVENLEDYEELWMMSICKNNIMSSSSFSWWGSFLNFNKNKKVLVPEKWFGPNGPAQFDSIYEKNWIKINF